MIELPLPEPKENENEEEFIERCTSAEIMEEEFPDEDQRLAVCQNIWDENNNDEEEEENNFSNKPEVRIINTNFEIKQEAEEEEEKIKGYAAVFNDPAEEQMGFIEKIAPGAFRNAIKKSDTRALINHNPEKILGRKSAGTLKLREDEKGLYYEVDPPDTSYANDLIESMKRGDIDQSSFGFVVAEEKWEENGEVPVRTILEVEELHDVSPVTFPWYQNTESGIKSKNEVLSEYRNSKRTQSNQGSLNLYKKKIKINQRSVL